MNSLDYDKKSLIARRLEFLFLFKNKIQRKTHYEIHYEMLEILEYYKKETHDEVFTYFILYSFVEMRVNNIGIISEIFNMINDKIYYNLTYLFNTTDNLYRSRLFSLTDLEKLYFIMKKYNSNALVNDALVEKNMKYLNL